jgi:hypothetical protein
MGKMLNAYTILFRQPEGRRPLISFRCTWEDNIRMDLKKTGWEGVD